MFNLFDVSKAMESHIGPRNRAKLNDKPRQPYDCEIVAYLNWVASREGVFVPNGAQFRASGIWVADECIVEMPGYGQVQTVTMETLDESGEVIAAQTLPVEPKKGGVIWSRADVRKAYGPITKPARKVRGKAAAKVAPPIEAIGPDVEPVEACAPVVEAPAIDNPLADRVEALEAKLTALAAQMANAPLSVETGRPVRTAAHARAIQRAWDMRKAARVAAAAQKQAETHLRLGQAQYDMLVEDIAEERARVERLAGDLGDVRAALRLANGKRQQTTIRARHMIRGKRAAARMWADQCATLRKSMADPSQPERASDIHRLVSERDQARTALAAVNMRNVALVKSMDDLSDGYEAMVSRAMRAEAANRAAGIAA